MSRSASLWCALVMTACGASETPPPKAAQEPSEPETPASGENDIKVSFAREASALKETPSNGEGPRARPLAAGEVTAEKIEGVTRYTIPIGTEAPVRCLALQNVEDAGARLGSVLDGAKEKVSLRKVAPEPSRVVKEAPVVGLQATYTTGNDKAILFGHLKAAYHARLDAAGFCVHDEVGYAKTFRQVADSFFETLEVNPQDEATYHEVQFATVNDAPAGYTFLRLLPGQQGANVYQRRTFLMLQRSDTEMYFSDSAEVFTLDKDGTVSQAWFFEGEKDRLTLEIELKREKGAKYVYAGELQGKKLQGTVSTKTPKGWSGPTMEAQELKRRMKAGKPFTWVVEKYDPGVDPTRFEEFSISRTAKDGPRDVYVKASQMEMAGNVDEAGLMEKGAAKIGPVTLLVERAYKRGSL